MKGNVFIAIAFVLALFLQSSCNREQTKADRLKEIDAQLANWMPTGRPEDAQKRLALKNERNRLAADLGYEIAGPAPVAVPVANCTPTYGAPGVVVARQSDRADNRWQPMASNSNWYNSSGSQVYDRPIYSRPQYNGSPQPHP